MFKSLGSVRINSFIQQEIIKLNKDDSKDIKCYKRSNGVMAIAVKK